MASIARIARKRRVRLTGSDRVFHGIDYIILTIAWVAVIYPILNVLANSFSSSNAVAQGFVYLFPVEPSLLAYKAVFRNKWLMTGYANTIFYATVGTIINLTITVMAAYPLSIKRLTGRGVFMFIFTFMKTPPPQTTLRMPVFLTHAATQFTSSSSVKACTPPAMASKRWFSRWSRSQK